MPSYVRSIDSPKNARLQRLYLSMTVHTPDGTRIAGQFGMCGPGQPEYFIFEPHVIERSFLVCITVNDADTPAPVPYTLTFVDFDM